MISADGLVRYQSPAVEQVLGHPPEELIGRSHLELVHPDDREAAERLFERSKIQRDPHDPVIGEVRMLPRDGESPPKRFEMTVADLLHDPTVHGLVLNYRDITERALYQEQLTQQAFHDPLTGLPNRARSRSGWSPPCSSATGPSACSSSTWTASR